MKLLGTGLWDDPAITAGQTLLLAAGSPRPSRMPTAPSTANIKTSMARPPPQLASLAYDADRRWWRCCRNGQPYHRFTQAALMDPNGFSGVDGIFRFNTDGTSERGLAVLEVAARRLPCRQPGAENLPGAKLLVPEAWSAQRLAMREGGMRINSAKMK